MQVAKDINSTWADRANVILHRITEHLTNILRSSHSKWDMRFVYKLRDYHTRLDYYQRRILELSDGRSVEELVERLYREELAAGGWIVCLGLFETQYKREMLEEVNQLIKEGYLYCDYREARPAYSKAALSISEWIRTHKRVYRKIARANRLCKKITEAGPNGKQADAAQFLRSLTDIRISINSGNSIFTSKESGQIQEMTTRIYYDFCTHTN